MKRTLNWEQLLRLAPCKNPLLYPNGMTENEVADMLDEIDQQLGIRQIEMQLLKRA